MIQLWSAIAVALLTVVIGPLLRGEVAGRLMKRLKAHAQLRVSLEGHVGALRHLDELILVETEALKLRELHRLNRKLNGGNVAALIFVAISGGGAVFGLVSWALAAIGNPLAFWLLIAVAVLVGLFSIALAAAGVGLLFAPPRQK